MTSWLGLEVFTLHPSFNLHRTAARDSVEHIGIAAERSVQMGGVDLIGQVAFGQVLGALDQARQLGQHPRQSDEGTDGQQGHKYTDPQSRTLR